MEHWDEACALDFRNASEIVPPDSVVVRQAVNIKDNICNMQIVDIPRGMSVVLDL